MRDRHRTRISGSQCLCPSFSLPRSQTQTSQWNQNQSKTCKVNQRLSLGPHEVTPCSRSQAMGVCQQPRDQQDGSQGVLCVPGVTSPSLRQGLEGRSPSSLHPRAAPPLQQVPVGWHHPPLLSLAATAGMDFWTEILPRIGNLPAAEQSRKMRTCVGIYIYHFTLTTAPQASDKNVIRP